MSTVTVHEWDAQARELFGLDYAAWAFECPACRAVRTIADYTLAKTPPARVGRFCLACNFTARAGAGVRIADDDQVIDYALPWARTT